MTIQQPVGVPDEGSEYPGATLALYAILDVVPAEGCVGLRLDHPEQQVVPRHLGDHGLPRQGVVEIDVTPGVGVVGRGGRPAWTAGTVFAVLAVVAF